MRDAFFFVFYCNSNECFAFGTKTSFSWPFSAHIDLVVQTMGSTLDYLLWVTPMASQKVFA